MNRIARKKLNPGQFFVPLAKKGLFRWMPDNLYIRVAYRCETGRKLDLHNPQTYTEKLQWLKLNDRDPTYQKLVDKFNVREHVAKKLGRQHLVELIGCYESVDEIDFSGLPNEFVLKATHGSAWNIICFDKKKLDIEEVKRELRKWMRWRMYDYGREWPYKGVRPRIICERMLKTNSGKVPDDYKFFCFDGQPKVVILHKDRFGDHSEAFYDIKWNKLDVSATSGNASQAEDEVPINYDDMVRIARELSYGFRHVRIDLYNLQGKIYFGEITFFPGSGFILIEPEKYNKLWGSWIRID